MVAALFVTPLAVTAEIVGAVVSNTIVLVTDPDQLPAPSLYCTYTVFVPAPVASVHAFVVAYVSAVEKLDPVFENRICVTPLSASLADSVSVTAVVFVTVAPLLITTVPVGA
jgi:hypothetical protein